MHNFLIHFLRHLFKLTCMHACMLSHFSCAWLFAMLWTVAHKAPLSMGFSMQEYWSGLPFPSPGDLSNQGIKPMSLKYPALAGRVFTTSATREVLNSHEKNWLISTHHYSVSHQITAHLPHHLICCFWNNQWVLQKREGGVGNCSLPWAYSSFAYLCLCLQCEDIEDGFHGFELCITRC